jgi:hypothetical protein
LARRLRGYVEDGVAGGIYGNSNVIDLSATGNGTTTTPMFLAGLEPSTLVVPEPTNWALLSVALVALVFSRHRKPYRD